MAELTPFPPSWVYNADGRSELVTDQATYTQMLGEGWATSPAAFGRITAPSASQLAVLPHARGVVLQQTGQDATAFGHLLLQWEERFRTFQQDLEACAAQLAVSQEMQSAGDATLAALKDRVQVVEQWIVLMEGSGSSQQPGAASSAKAPVETPERRPSGKPGGRGD